MKKILLLIAIITLLTLTACSIDGESEVYNHLQNQDPSSLHTDDSIKEKDNEIVTNDPRCLGQYSAEDIMYRDIEKRATIEKNIDLCDELPELDLRIECPQQVTLVYYSKERCKQLISG